MHGNPRKTCLHLSMPQISTGYHTCVKASDVRLTTCDVLTAAIQGQPQATRWSTTTCPLAFNMSCLTTGLLAVLVHLLAGPAAPAQHCQVLLEEAPNSTQGRLGH
jgi:hypothetical protein